MPKLAFCRVWEAYPHGLSVQRWACNGCGQLTRTAFECQDGLVRAAFECQDGACKECGQLTHRAFEYQDRRERGAGSLSAGPLTAKMGL